MDESGKSFSFKYYFHKEVDTFGKYFDQKIF